MHPATLGRLLDEVARLVAGKPVQVFMSTQSLEVLSWLALAMRETEQQTSLKPSDVCTLRLQLVGGTLQVQTFPGESIGSWMELFGDPRTTGEDELISPLARFLRMREVEP